MQPLITVTDRLVAREGHPIFSETDAAGKIAASSVSHFPWLEFVSSPDFGTQARDTLFGALGFRPKPMMTCRTLETAVGLLQRSDYVAILPDALTSDSATPSLCPVPLSIHTNCGLAGMICRAEMAEWPQTTALLAACRQWIKHHSGTDGVTAEMVENGVPPQRPSHRAGSMAGSDQA